MTDKEKQRELIVEIMKADEQSGLYTTRKQTAVDWFASKVMYLKISPSEMHEFLEWYEKAKQMEKEQIKEAFDNGYHIGYFDRNYNLEQYYKETYE
jgi:hypothetical protein